MSAAIRNALTDLNGVIDRLEGALDKREKSLTATAKNVPQADLFAAPQRPTSVSVSKSSGTVVTLDSALLAKKLDVAISRVEQLLREG